MALAVSSKCSEHILLAQECVKASLAMLTNTSHLSWRADLVILEENICETTVLKFLLERDQTYDCCNRPRSTLACFLFSWICLILLMCILVKRKYLSYGWQYFRIFYCMKWSFKCVPRRLWRLPTQLPLRVLDSDWSTKSEWRGLWISAIWYGLRVIMSITQLPRYSHAFFIDSICNGHIFITIHELKPWVFFSFKQNSFRCWHRLSLIVISTPYPYWKDKVYYVLLMESCPGS